MSFAKSCYDSAYAEMYRTHRNLEVIEKEIYRLHKSGSWKNCWNLYRKFKIHDRWIKAHNEHIKAKKEWDDLWR
jgi:hypothetical protein